MSESLDDLQRDLQRQIHERFQELAPKLVAELAKDKAMHGNGHSMIESWQALNAQAQQHGYGAHLELPHQNLMQPQYASNLEVSYTDPEGARTPIESMLFPGGDVQTIHDGVQSNPQINNDMSEQTTALRGALQMDVEVLTAIKGHPLDTSDKGTAGSARRSDCRKLRKRTRDSGRTGYKLQRPDPIDVGG